MVVMTVVMSACCIVFGAEVYTDPIMVDVPLNGVEVKIEVDTGESVSLISEETLSVIKNENTCITKVKDKLITYTGKLIAVLGTVQVEVQYRGKTHTLPLHVTKGAQQPLLDRKELAVKGATRSAKNSNDPN